MIIIYNKSSLVCVGTLSEGVTVSDEILLNVIPNFGGVESDYDVIETELINFELIEENGEIVTSELEKPSEIEGKEIQLVQNEQGEWEYIYVDIPLTKEQELEKEIASLRTMLESLVGGGA